MQEEKIIEVLGKIRDASSEIQGAAIVGIEGFAIASDLSHEIDEEIVAGMGSAMLGVGERISTELMQATMEQTFVKHDAGYIVLNAIGDDAMLIVVTSDRVKLGMIFLSIRRFIPELQDLLKE